ncbi:MAG: hypothetical protein O3B72_13650, partial [Proteobacteria bacterium]|nr:hypothetical protein [Pseudomonadota bacterium]
MKKTLIAILLCVSLPALGEFSRGANYAAPPNPDRFQQHQQYLEALELIRSNQFTRYERLKPSLRTYALFPYLEYTYMAWRISGQSEQDMLAFREQYTQTPLVEPLMQHWLSNLAKRGEWALFVKYYPEVSADKTLACRYGTALIKTGDTESALQHAESLWRVGYSQPDECDPVFNLWRNNGGLTPALAWERFALSLDASNSKLSKYLMRFVDRDDKSFATNYRLVHFQPKTVKRFNAFRADHQRNREIVLHGIRRLARVDAIDAAETLRRYESIHHFDPDQLEATWAYVGVRLALASSNLSLTESLPLNLHDYPEVTEARIRQSLKYGDFSNVLVLINLLPEDLQASSRWQYWKARVLARSEGEGDRLSAREIFTSLADERSFYGFLAADILDLPYNFQDQTEEVTLEQVLSLEKAPGIQRALELYSLGERSRARREWYFSTAEFTPSERSVAARLALRWGWSKAAI